MCNIAFLIAARNLPIPKLCISQCTLHVQYLRNCGGFFRMQFVLDRICLYCCWNILFAFIILDLILLILVSIPSYSPVLSVNVTYTNAVLKLSDFWEVSHNNDSLNCPNFEIHTGNGMDRFIHLRRQNMTRWCRVL